MSIFNLKKSLYTKRRNLFFHKVGLATFLSFGKVDFCDIVQKKTRVTSSGILQKTEKTNFSMNVVIDFIVSFLGFVRNNKKSTRKLNE